MRLTALHLNEVKEDKAGNKNKRTKDEDMIASLKTCASRMIASSGSSSSSRGLEKKRGTPKGLGSRSNHQMRGKSSASRILTRTRGNLKNLQPIKATFQSAGGECVEVNLMGYHDIAGDTFLLDEIASFFEVEKKFKIIFPGDDSCFYLY